MKTKNILGTLSIIGAFVNPALGLLVLTVTGWEYYDEYKKEKMLNKVMRDLIKSNNIGIRKVVGNEKMDQAIDLIK